MMKQLTVSRNVEASSEYGSSNPQLRQLLKKISKAFTFKRSRLNSPMISIDFEMQMTFPTSHCRS